MKSATAFLLSSISLAAAYVPVPWIDPNQAANQNPPPRLDIDVMQASYKEQFDLYILAMQKWQTTSQNDASSYYQVCGIHGAPHVAWDNAGSFQTKGYSNLGYCYHDEQNFYLWHRPYLRLFELQLISTANSIANSWNQAGRAKYQAAAKQLRMPYWDWAKGSRPGTVPQSISSPSATVTSPTTNQQISIPNPLYRHTLVTGASSNLGTYSGGFKICLGNQGSNCGVSLRSGSYLNDMVNVGPSLQRWVALLLNTPNLCWNVFATYDNNEHNIAACRGNPAINSLEGIHNSIHNTVGGTMSNLDVAAFDPIFWLHHTNVDRIGALWQALNPNTKIVTTTLSSGNFAQVAGRSVDQTFQLQPFRWQNTNTDWWEPVWLYDTRTTGYTYPELQGNPSKATVQSRVNAIYGNGRAQQALATGSRKFRRADWLAHLQYRQEITTNGANLTIPPPTSALAPVADTLIAANGSYKEYTAKISIQKSAVAGKSFSVHLFFGDPSPESISHSDYLNEPNRIGGFSISSSPAMDPSNNQGGMKMDNVVVGFAPITDALLHVLLLGDLKDMNITTVRKYCRAKLTWRLVTVGGQDVGKEGLRHGLNIRILHQVITPNGGANTPPTVSPPDQIVDSSNATSAQPLPSGVAATTLTATVTGAAAASGLGPVPAKAAATGTA